MVSRADEATFPVRVPRTAARHRAFGLTRAQRFLFVLALVTFGLASSYTGVSLLSRITPALFPGRTLGSLASSVGIPTLPNLPTLPGISTQNDDTVFNKRINLLIMGVDQRPLGKYADSIPDNERWKARTDTLMVATIDPVSKTTSFLGFPRDMVFDIHTQNYTYGDRINASFIAGLDNGGSVDAGAAQLEKDLKLNLGIDINYYVLMDFTGVEKLVDAVGGVDIDVPDDLAIYGWFYSDDDINGRFVTFPPGKQHVDGYHAVAFGRNRDPSDMARVKRQQVVLKAALQKVFNEGLLSPDTWPGLWDAYNTTIRTDIPYSRMAGYALLMQSTNGRATFYSAGDPVDGRPTVWGITTELGASMLEWDPDNVQYWLSQTFTKAAYSQSTVEIQNGYGDGGTARVASLGRYLAYSKGLPTVQYGPDQPPQADTTITLFGESRRVLAEDIAKWLGIPKEQIKLASKNGDATLPDVVIVIGRNYKIPT